MKWIQKIFRNTPEDRIKRAKLFLEKNEFNNARIELLSLEHPEASPLKEEARKGLILLNLSEAKTCFFSGNRAGAEEHLLLAKNFGAKASEIREIRRNGRTVQISPPSPSVKSKPKPTSPVKTGNDPLWSLPPDHPHIRYAMLLEKYPTQLRERLVNLGTEFAEITLQIQDGKNQASFERLSEFVEIDPVCRFERARASLQSGMIEAAVSDLALFGQEVGHCIIGGQHTSALLSHLLAQLGRTEDALFHIQESLKTEQHSSVLMIKARILEDTRKFTEAVEITANLLKKFPKSLPLIRQLARIRIKQNQRVLAAEILERGLAQCCASGQCGSQPLDLISVRMLARIYLEDRVLPGRSNELLLSLQKHSSAPIWEDQYLSLLNARNNSQPFVQEMATSLVEKLPQQDPRRNQIHQAFFV